MRRSFGKILVGIVVFGLCLGAAFGAGTVYGRHSITRSASAAESPASRSASSAASSATSVPTATSSARSTAAASGFASGSGFAFGGGFGNRPIQGTVSSINVQQLAVSLGTNSATTTTLTLNAATIYAVAQSASKDALKSGDDVDVTTTTASDGTISALSVIVVPALPKTSVEATPRAGGTSGPSSPARTGGFSGSGGRSFGGGGAANRPVDGTIASISANQLSVTLASGSSTTVTLTAQTTYQTTQTASQSAVTNGAPVLVTISRDSSGTSTATSVIVLPKTS